MVGVPGQRAALHQGTLFLVACSQAQGLVVISIIQLAERKNTWRHTGLAMADIISAPIPLAIT